jgi:hypothetical protein
MQKKTANETKRLTAVIRKGFDRVDTRIRNLERETRSSLQKIRDHLEDARADVRDLPILRDILQEHDEQLEQHGRRLKRLEQKAGIVR